jgi:release factor glutamine methyltransferase
MRVASNAIKHMADFFYSELSGIYPASEIKVLFEHSVSHYTQIPLGEIARKGEEKLNQSELILIYDSCKALRRHIPLQYILGETFFYGKRIKVTPSVLIPRPETEELVDIVIKENKHPQALLDIGTGSGCIPVALKSHYPSAAVWACDVSKDALAVASKNATLNKTDVHFFEADVLDAKNFLEKTSANFDVIVSNPPYIKDNEKADMAPNVTNNEPHLALFVKGDDPIIFYKHIISICASKLNSQGKLYFELNPFTANDVLEAAAKSGLFQGQELVKDMSGNVRFLKATRS